MLNGCGIVYVATGSKCRSEASNNILLSQPNLIGLKTCLITDEYSDNESRLFDHVNIHSSPVYSYRDKISGLLDLPFEYNLFLDSDAFLSSSPIPIFELSSICDFAAAHAPVRHPPGWSDSNVPHAFPEFNSGVMLIKRSEATSSFLRSWLFLYDEIFQKFAQEWDQASLRSVLWDFLSSRQLSVSVLPPEANLRTTKPWIAGRGLPVSVIHGRFPPSEVKPLISFLNSDIDRFRTWVDWLKLYPDSFIRPRFDRTFS